MAFKSSLRCASEFWVRVGAAGYDDGIPQPSTEGPTYFVPLTLPGRFYTLPPPI